MLGFLCKLPSMHGPEDYYFLRVKVTCLINLRPWSMHVSLGRRRAQPPALYRSAFGEQPSIRRFSRYMSPLLVAPSWALSTHPSRGKGVRPRSLVRQAC